MTLSLSLTLNYKYSILSVVSFIKEDTYHIDYLGLESLV
jgi:hypothetical protein